MSMKGSSVFELSVVVFMEAFHLACQWMGSLCSLMGHVFQFWR